MQELQLDEQQYQRLRALVQLRSGLFYADHKRADLLQGLQRTSRECGISDPDQLYAGLSSNGLLWDTLILHLTIGETYFFRNRPQFAALRSTILPELMERRAMSQHMRIWSAGCATGEEPYSIAMELRELFQHSPGWLASILATDINPAFLARAQAGLYGAWSFRDTPDAVRDRYFVPQQNRWRIKPEISQMVRFMRLNLAEPSYPSLVSGTCAMDLIVCRNVTIYFDAATTRAVVERLYHALTPGGWLIVGHAEPQASIYHAFEVQNFPDTVVYRKPLSAPMIFTDQPLELPPPPSSLASPGAPPPQPMPSAANPRTTPPKPAAPQPRHVPAPGPAPAQSAAPQPAQIGVAQLLAQAQQAADQGNWQAAAALCLQILEREPLLVAAHYLQAQLFEQQDDLDQALAAYRKTTYLDRSFVLGMLGMGHIWRKKGRSAEARRCYRNALNQLQQLPPQQTVAGSAALTAAELVAAVRHLLHTLADKP